MRTPSADENDLPNSGEASADVFESVLAACIESWSIEGGGAIESLCAKHPALAARLRARLADLQRLGLLGDERPPDSIGPYRILRVLGQGGMSVVYLAWDAERGRRVALKASHTPLSSDDRSRARFRQEISAVTALDHPSIVPLLDVGESGGRPYFTMEFVPGATLAQIVEELRRRGARPTALSGEDISLLVHDVARTVQEEEPRSPSDAHWPSTWVEAVVRWMLEVAEALAHAHERGVIHRDVKPSNVMLSLDGRAHLFDMGLARLTDAPGLTRSGDFTGTPYYVSPEQLTGHMRDVDHRTDVFSMGVTLYELLCFQRPFDGPSTARVFRQIVDRDPRPLRRLEPRLPADLETICLAALEKDPAARYQTMGDLAADLRRFLEFRPVRARPVGWLRRGVRFMRRSPARATAALLALVVIIGLPSGLLWANRAIAEERDHAEAAADEAERLAELSAHVTDFLVGLFRLTPVEVERAQTVTAREILDLGAGAIPTGFEVQPRHRAALMQASGRVYRNMGLFDEALPLLDRAYAIFQRELGNDDLETVTLLAELADVHRAVGDLRASQALCRRSLAGFSRAGADGQEQAVRCRMTLASVSAALGEPDEAHDELTTALRSCTEADDVDSILVADLLEQLGGLQADAGAFPEAADRLQASLDLRRASWVPEPAAIARGLERLAAVRREQRAPELAIALEVEAQTLRESLMRQRTTLAVRPAVSNRGQLPDSPFSLQPADRAEFDASFQDGVTALQSGDYASAAAAFRHCLVVTPRHAVSAYNVACSHALAGETEPGILWLDKAIEFGFGFLVDGRDVLEKDPDLAALRSDRRWSGSLARMQSGREAAQRYAADPALHVPEALRSSDKWPLLVVLHGSGASKTSVVEGPWRAVADELGLVLLAPSARLPVGPDVEDGMRWFPDVDDFLQRPGAYESPVIEDIRTFCETHPVDNRRVFIAGEGLGALLAADLALTAPGLFHGLLLVNGPIVPELAWQRTLVASSLGLGIRVVLDDRRSIAGRPPGIDAAQLGERLALWLPRWGLDALAEVHVVAAADESPPEAAWITALQELEQIAAH